MPVSLERLIAEREAGVVTDELIRDCIVVCALICCAAAAKVFDAALSCSRAPVLTPGCLQVTTPCPELAEDKKRELAFEQVEVAAFSFRGLSSISNLWGLDKLVKLQLDNNRIQRIENLGHLVGPSTSRAAAMAVLASTHSSKHDATWLRQQHAAYQLHLLLPLLLLLSSQTNLTWLDLSFNRITAIEGLEQLTRLSDLSLFNNQISSLQGLDTLQNLNVLSIGQQQGCSWTCAGCHMRRPFARDASHA
jgi:hypothetical protein